MDIEENKEEGQGQRGGRGEEEKTEMGRLIG